MTTNQKHSFPLYRSTLAGLAVLAATLLTAPTGAAPVESLVLEVEGMTADHCEEYITGVLLHGVEGLAVVEADHETDRVTIAFDPAVISPEEIAGAIDWCPSYRVTGSATHELDLDGLQEHHRWRCSVSGLGES